MPGTKLSNLFCLRKKIDFYLKKAFRGYCQRLLSRLLPGQNLQYGSEPDPVKLSFFALLTLGREWMHHHSPHSLQHGHGLEHSWDVGDEGSCLHGESMKQLLSWVNALTTWLSLLGIWKWEACFWKVFYNMHEAWDTTTLQGFICMVLLLPAHLFPNISGLWLFYPTAPALDLHWAAALPLSQRAVAMQTGTGPCPSPDHQMNKHQLIYMSSA